jgi:hypothetical protein
MSQKLLETDILGGPSFVTMQVDSLNATIRFPSAQRTPLPQNIYLNKWQVIMVFAFIHIMGTMAYSNPLISSTQFKSMDRLSPFQEWERIIKME